MQEASMKDESTCRAVDDVLKHFGISCTEKDGKLEAVYDAWGERVQFFKLDDAFASEHNAFFNDSYVEVEVISKEDFAREFAELWCFKSGPLVMKNEFYGLCIEEAAMKIDLIDDRRQQHMVDEALVQLGCSHVILSSRQMCEEVLIERDLACKV